MDCHTISQCHLDGDLYALRCKKFPFNILYGTIAKHSSLLRYLPKNYYEFQTGAKDETKDDLKRQKIIEKDMTFKKEILRPINELGGCFQETVPMDFT